jgi:hypothetical protein
MPDVLHLDIQLPPVLQLRLLRPPQELPADMANVIVGKPGAPGGSTYTHTQSIAASVWTVAHNLGRRPSVAVTDHLGVEIYSDVRWIDDNLVQITHGNAITGFVYCN